jgi:putative membrane protein
MKSNVHTIRTGTGAFLLGTLAVAVGSGLVGGHSGTNGGWHMGSGGWMLGGFGWLWMLLGLLVPIALLVGLAYLLRVWGTTAESADLTGSERGDPALKALRERYARGEIDEEEYETRREQLS